MKVLILIPVENKEAKTFDECSIVVDDGGLATIHHTSEHLTIDYYQNRVKTHSECIFQELAEGKMYYDDIEYADVVNDKVIKQALHWLVTPNDDIEFVIEHVHFNPKKESESELISRFVLGYSPKELGLIVKNINVHAGDFMNAIAKAITVADNENSLKLQRTFAHEFKEYLNFKN